MLKCTSFSPLYSYCYMEYVCMEYCIFCMNRYFLSTEDDPKRRHLYRYIKHIHIHVLCRVKFGLCCHRLVLADSVNVSVVVPAQTQWAPSTAAVYPAISLTAAGTSVASSVPAWTIFCSFVKVDISLFLFCLFLLPRAYSMCVQDNIIYEHTLYDL